MSNSMPLFYMQINIQTALSCVDTFFLEWMCNKPWIRKMFQSRLMIFKLLECIPWEVFLFRLCWGSFFCLVWLGTCWYQTYFTRDSILNLEQVVSWAKPWYVHLLPRLPHYLAQYISFCIIWLRNHLSCFPPFRLNDVEHVRTSFSGCKLPVTLWVNWLLALALACA